MVTDQARPDAPASGREPEQKREQAQNRESPTLSEQFYLQLLELPMCKTSGICDGCGRCEH